MNNLTQKVIGKHRQEPEQSAKGTLRLSVDQILIEDATGTMTAMQFEELGLDSVEVPLAVMYVDHNVLQIDDKNMQDHQYLKTFSERYGVRYCTPGSGIAHYVHLERFASPGQVLVGADSHTSTAGSMGMLAIGAGGLEVAVAMGGYGFDTTTPHVVGVELQGHLPKWAQAKDVSLELLRRYGVREGRGKVFEFYGEGVSTLSIPERATICNMIIETGATTGIFPSDAATQSWLSDMHREDQFIELGPDPGATYDSYETIYLPEVVPLISLPSSPGNVVPVSEVEGTSVVQVCVGSSVNSSYEDLACVAEILKGRKVADGVQLTVTPGSKSILQEIIASGVYQSLATAGARMLEPICGPCVGIGQAPVAQEASLRTFNRNFPGRSGTAEDSVYLCSPATAGWSALYGHIKDPSSHEDISISPSPFRGDYVNDTLITEVRPLRERLDIDVVKGSNLVAPRFGLDVVNSCDAAVVASVGDDVSTGDMAPDGVIAMSVWSNIEACSKFMFNRLDSGFYDRARNADYGIILGGENYGQGSSREHAALVPMHLGVRIVAAKSFARIHRRNLISCGIVPLVLPQSVPDEATGVDTRWKVRSLIAALSSGDEEFVISTHVRGEQYNILCRLDLTEGERETLLAGGLLPLVRRGARAKV